MALSDPMRLTLEEKLILASARLNPQLEDIESLMARAAGRRGGIDGRKLGQLACINGVAPLLYKNLKDIPTVPEALTSVLRKAYLLAVAGNLEKKHELLRLLRVFKAQGIAAITLKGVMASEIIFENPGLYYGADIDLLIRPSNLQRAKQILMDEGYQYDARLEPAVLAAHYHISLNNKRHWVELHWNLVKRYFDIPSEFWWENPVSGRYDGCDMLFLAPEKYLIYTIFRLFSHMFQPLKFLVLISEISNRYHDGIDWDTFERDVKKYKMFNLATFTLKLANQLLGTKIPDRFARRKVRGGDSCRAAVLATLFRGVPRPYLNKIRYGVLLDSPGFAARSFARRLVPREAELRLRYKIPENSGHVYMYYLLNPFLLALMLLKKNVSTRR